MDRVFDGKKIKHYASVARMFKAYKKCVISTLPLSCSPYVENVVCKDNTLRIYISSSHCYLSVRKHIQVLRNACNKLRLAKIDVIDVLVMPKVSVNTLSQVTSFVQKEKEDVVLSKKAYSCFESLRKGLQNKSLCKAVDSFLAKNKNK